MSTEERFWAKVDKRTDDECWPWTASLVRGYGWLSRGGQSAGRIYAHRLSFEMHYGPIPDGLSVLHHCDNPPCVNPRHLFSGTQADNIADKVQKGRQQRGEQAGGAKLTTREVIEIKRARSAGTAVAALASQFGVNKSAISRIANGTRWAHVAVAT